MKGWIKSIGFAVCVMFAAYGIAVAMTVGSIHAARTMGITVFIAVDGGGDQ